MPERRLVLVRHAEAGSAVVDADRQLTPRGAEDAAAAGTWLGEVGVVPDRVIVSSARRARQTWGLAAEALEFPSEPVVDERLYENTLELLLEVIRETPAEVGTLVVVGHNPSVGELAHSFADDGSDPNTGTRLAGFPAGTAAVFELSVAFDAVEPGSAILADVRSPAH